jgi:hypothetical protein
MGQNFAFSLCIFMYTISYIHINVSYYQQILLFLPLLNKIRTSSAFSKKKLISRSSKSWMLITGLRAIV